MVEAMGMVGIPRVVIQAVLECINHCVIGRSIIACNTQTLATGKYHISFKKIILDTNLFRYPKILEDFRKHGVLLQTCLEWNMVKIERKEE